MPALKKFVKEDVNAYENISVEFKSGAAPTATFIDADGREVNTISLPNISTQEVLALFATNGFVPRLKAVDPPAVVVDAAPAAPATAAAAAKAEL